MDVYQTLHVPRPKVPKPHDLSKMLALVSSYPPLNQVTVVSSANCTFTVLLETDRSRASDPWEASIWHSNPQGWVETKLEALHPGHARMPSSLEPTSDTGHQRLFFTGDLEVLEGVLDFTIKFRNSPNAEWRWTKDNQGCPDGTLIRQGVGRDSIDGGLGDYFKNLNPALRWKKVRSQSPGTSVWSIVAPVEAAQGDESAVVDVKFGLPWGGHILRWFALVRSWAPWLVPRHGKSHFELDREAIVCSFLERGGRHVLLLALSGIEDVRTLLKSDGKGGVTLNIRNDRPEEGLARVVVAVGNDFEHAMAAAVYHARNVVAGDERASGPTQREAQTADDGVKAQWMENWFDGLSYCTWNGIGQGITDEKLYHALDTLAASNINITNLIIDDGWQTINHRGDNQFQHGWMEFEADKQAFPKGLKHTVSTIREKHKHIQHVAVWHALLGYWAGIAPEGKIAQTYKTTEVLRIDGLRRNLDMGGPMTVVAKDDVFRMYDDFYRFLSSCGVDAVKTDAQFMLDTFASAGARRDLTTTYQDAWTISTLNHFSIKAISCMSQVPQIMFHSQMPQNKPALLVRNSDDFFPEVETSHAWHVFTNAHNSLFTQHLNILPDWDMFQTVHDYSGFHAAARCVSGGPIYITDVPGRHNIDLIKQMSGETTRGKTVIFRPNVGKSLDAYVSYEDEVLLKVGTYHGMAVTGTSFIGLFNISQRPLTELIPLGRFLGVVDTSYYIVRSHVSGRITEPLHVVDPNSLICMSLDPRGYDILSAYPLRGFSLPGREETTWIANLGLLGKMTGAAAIESNEMYPRENGTGIVIETKLKALGVLGIYFSDLPYTPVESSFLVTIQGRVIPKHAVSVSETEERVLEIGVERAWREMGLKSGWGNEVEVRILRYYHHGDGDGDRDGEVVGEGVMHIHLDVKGTGNSDG